MFGRTLFILCLLAPTVSAQVDGKVSVGTSVERPLACSLNDLYVTSDTNLIYQCRALDTWTVIPNLNTALLLRCKKTENIRCVDAANSAGWSGTTADAWINSAIANLPASGGTVDARGFGGGPQTIASTVNVGNTSKPVTLLLDPATVFTAGSTSTDMFSIGPNGIIDGLTVNNTSLATYSGNVVKIGVIGTCSNQQECRLTNFNISNGTAMSGVPTGNAILLESVRGSTNVAWVDIAFGKITGFQNGIFIDSLGTPGSLFFTNGNHVSNVVVTNAVNCFNLTSNNGDVIGNMFVEDDCQFKPQSVRGIYTVASAGAHFYGNIFRNVNLWDYGPGQTGVIWDANVFDNVFDGTAVSVGGPNLTDNANPSTNFFLDWFDNQFGDPFPVWNISGNFQINTSNDHGLLINVPGGGWTLAPQSNGTDLDFVRSGIADEFKITTTSIKPTTNGGLSLGTNANGFSSVNLSGIPVSSLPSAAANPGAIMYVTDSTPIAAEGQTCAGGASTKSLAFSNGTTWKCF
jgi:hypothetical protein